MPEKTAGHGLDPLLVPFRQAPEGDDAERLLTVLVEREVTPVVTRVLQGRLEWRRSRAAESSAVLEDLRNQVLVHVVVQLRRIRENGDGIGNLKAYVKTLARNAYYQYLRDRRPERHRLSSMLREILAEAPPLALWEVRPGDWRTGLAAWRGRSATAALADVEPPLPLSATDPRRRFAEFLVAFLGQVGGPVRFGDLVNRIAEIVGIHDRRHLDLEEACGEDASGPGELAWTSRQARGLNEVEATILFEQLWYQICQLPLWQRRVYVLTFDEPELWTTVASIHQIADAMAMAPLALARLWPDLPLADQVLADTIGSLWQHDLTRQQVSNLRLAARQRLARRLRINPRRPARRDVADGRPM